MFLKELVAYVYGVNTCFFLNQMEILFFFRPLFSRNNKEEEEK